MSADRARSIFIELVGSVPPEQWDSRLAELANEDQGLRARVGRLLAEHRKGDRFLEQPAAPFSGTVDWSSAPGARAGSLSGTSTPCWPAANLAGRYLLLEEIGKGGMGTVWKARQIEPVKRPVAVKLIKPGMECKQVLARFEAERQALALMEDAHIPKVLDAGTTETGHPYFVMEYIDGDRITGYCDAKKLPIRRRLELFVQVCQAIQHAHQKSIIHRDVKPSNVLVTTEGDLPQVKVIDFGIAKAVERRLTANTLVTQFGTAVGTLEYMSPEQARPSAAGIDTRTDVYSLGVLLYELLTGTTPLDRSRLKNAGVPEVVRLICEEDPPRPSIRLANAPDSLSRLAEQRGTEPARLTKEVRGDLDWITMKCLEKDRDRRYETANALVREIQRHLAHEPIETHPPSTAYRLGKFLRRNRGPVVVAAILVLALLVGMVGTTVGFIRESKARKDEQQARRDAESAARQERRAREELRKAFVQQVAERLESDLKALQMVGDTIQVVLATQERWEEEQLIASLEPLLRQDDRLFGLGLAFTPFRVPHSEAAMDPHALAAGLVGLLGTPGGYSTFLATTAHPNTGYCLYVYKGGPDPHALWATTVGLLGTPDGVGPLLGSCVHSATGYNKRAYYDGPYPIAHYPSAEYDHRLKDWFKVPLTEGRAFWTPIAGLDKEELDAFQTALISYVVPLRLQDEIVGVMCVDLAMKDFFASKKLDKRLQDLNYGRPSYAFVISNSQKTWNGETNRGKGIFLSHPNRNDELYQYPHHLLGLPGATPEFKAVARRMVAGETGTAVAEDPWTRTPSTFVFTPVQSENWTAEWTLGVVINEAPAP